MDTPPATSTPSARDGDQAPALHDEWALVNEEAEIVASVTTTPPQTGAATHDVGSTDAADGQDIPEGYLPIRLRKGEEIRPGWFKATQQVDDFIGTFFAEELTSGKKVRLIYMGMLLISNRSMGEYGIEEHGVIHCVITAAAPHAQATRLTQLKGLSDPRNSLLVLTGLFLYGFWTLFYHFPHFFSWKSIALLSLFSAAHISATVSHFMS